MKHINLIQMLQGCSKRNGMTVRQSNPDCQTTVNRQSRLMSQSGCSAVDVPMTSYGAPDEHPMSIRSASDGERWQNRGWKYVAMIFVVLVMSVANVGMAWGGTITWDFGSESSTLTQNDFTSFTGSDDVTVLKYMVGKSDAWGGSAPNKSLNMNGKSSWTGSSTNGYTDRYFTLKAPSASGTISITFAGTVSNADILTSLTGYPLSKATIVGVANSTIKSDVIAGLTAGTTDLYIVFPGNKAYIKSITWTDATLSATNVLYSSDYKSTMESGGEVSTNGSGGIKTSSLSADKGSYTTGYQGGASGAYATVTFASPLALRSDANDAGYIEIEWTHTSTGSGQLYINGGVSAVATYTSMAGTHGIHTTRYTIPKNTESISSIKTACGGSSNLWVYHVKVVTHSAAPSCTAPNHVDISGAWDRFGGETISLTATAYSSAGTGSPIADANITGWQWQKWYDDKWNDISDGTDGGATISGATTKNLQISNCSKNNSGSYQCVVSTGATCSTASSSEQVKVFVLECYTGGTTIYNFTRDGENQRGSVEIELSASTAYQFKFHVDNDYFGNNASITGDITNYVFCNSNNGGDCASNFTVNSGSAGGKFVFTMDYSTGGNSSVLGEPELSVTYPRKRIYMQPSSNWQEADAVFFIKSWGMADQVAKMAELSSCDAGVYYADIYASNTNCLFTRQDPDYASNIIYKNTTGNWAQSDDITISTNNSFSNTDWGVAFTGGSFSPTTYTISFAGNGNTSGSMTNVTGIECEEDVTLEENGYVKTGYTFTGWKDASSNDYADEATISNITADIALTAQWSAKQCTVSFNTNGGTGTITSVTATYDAAMPTKAGNLPTKTGYTFAGFFDGEGGTGNQYYKADGTSYTNWDKNTTSTTTLYAKWICTAPTFDTDLSTSTVNVNQHASASALSVEATANSGTITYQWYSNDENNYDTPSPISGATSASYTPSTETDGTTYYFCEAKNTTGGNCTTNSSITPVTVTATYRVVYNGNGKDGGSDVASSSWVTSGTDVTTVANTWTKSGYKFKWWNTENDGTGEDFYVGEKVTISSADVTLYAQWESVDSDEEFWVGDPKVWHATTHDVTVGDMNIKPQDYSSNDNMIDADFTGSNKEYTIVNATDKRAIVMALGAKDKYIEISFTDGSTINELDLGVAAKDGTNPKMAVLYSTTSDFSSGDYYFAEVEVPTIAQTSKQVTSADPDESDKYKYVRIYMQLYTAVYSETGGTGNKLRIYSVKAKKGASCTSPTIGSQPADVAICPGSTTTLTVSSITGGNTPYTYRWYDASDDSEVSSGSGYTTASFTTPTLDAAASYYCIVTENGGCTTQSETADVTMKTTTAITSGPSSVANAVVGSASSLSVTAEGTNLSYQWYTCDDDEKTNADDLDDETDATLSVTPASVGVTYYYCVVSGDCGTETSDVVSITAKKSISPSLSYASTVTYGSTISPTLSGAGDGSVTYSLNSVTPAGSLTINSSTGVVSGDAAGGTATVTATITAGDDYWGGSATSSTITVAKADLSVTATAGEADDVTHNSATLPFELSSTDGVGSVTLKVYDASDDSEPVKTVTGVTAATSGSGEVEGLEANTTYYFTVTPIGDSNHNNGSESDASDGFTTDDAPTLSALVAGTLYKVEGMVPASCTSITGSEAYWEGLSDNAKFFLVGSASSSTTMAVKNDSHEVDGTSFSNSYYFKSAATLSSNTPTDKAIKFIVPTGGGTLKVWVRNAAAIKLAKEGVAGTALHASDGSSAYHAYTKDVTAGTWYLYATGGSTTLYGVQLLVMHTLTTTVSGGVGGIVSAASSVAEGGTTTVTATPAVGYEVTNWAVSGTGASITPSGASSSATTTLTMGTTDATVTVTFGKANYNVTYDDNGSTGGSVPTDATDYHYGDEVTVSDNTGTLVKTGYTFRGWTSGDYFYKAGDKFTITGNTTLKAVWEEDSPTAVTYYYGSVAISAGALVKGMSGAAVQFFTYSSSTFANSTDISLTTAPSAAAFYCNSNDVSDWTSTSNWTTSSSSNKYISGVDFVKDGSYTLALGTKVASSITFIGFSNQSGDRTMTIGGVGFTQSTQSTFYSHEYTKVGGFTGNVTITETGSFRGILIITCAADANFNVSFANMTGFEGSATLPSTIVGVQSGKKILKPADPTTSGDYVFGGWYKEGSCTNAWNFESDKVTSDVTLYAKWYEADYTITWNVNGSTYATTKACDDVAIVLPTAPADNTLSDCANSFRGWSATNLYGASGQAVPSDLFVDAAGAPTIDDDKTFYAVFGTATDAAYKGTVLWSEDWTGATTASSASSSAAPSGQGDHSGKVVYFGGVASYSETTTGTYVRNENTGGGVAPELMIKALEAWTVSGIALGGAKTVNVSYIKNGNTLDVRYFLDGDSIGKNTVTSATSGNFDINCSGKSTLTLKFVPTASSKNVRLDNIVVKVKEDGATDYRCICPSLTVTPELVTASTPIFITSAASKTVRSQDRLHIVGSGLQKEATLSLTSPASKFVLMSSAGANLATDETGAIDAYGYIFYTPDAGDTSDGLDKNSTFTVSDGTNAEEVEQALIGRHLPADFVIAAKNTNNNKWYALPANFSDEQTPAPVEIAVDDINNPTIAYTANTNIYNLYGQNSGASGYLYNDGDSDGNPDGEKIKLGMKNNSNKPLFAFAGDKSSLKGDGTATVTNNISKQYWWTLTQTNTSISNPQDAKYTIASSNNSKTMSAWFNTTPQKWGLFAGGNGEHTLRIIPASDIVFAEAEIVAWGKNSAIVEVDNSTMIADYAIAKLPEDIASSAVTLSQTRTSVKNTGTRYNYTMDFGEGVDFSANGGKMLTLEWYDVSDDLKAISNIMVPCIVAEDITIDKTNYPTKSVWNKEVHVLPGVTVTVDADYSPNPDVTIKELVIYPGAKVVANTGTLKPTTLVLRNGWNRLTAKTEYDVAQLYITPTTGNLQATNAYADWYIDYDQYYPIAVPWKVATNGITYRNTSGAASDGVMIRYYDGEGRATYGARGANWVNYTWGDDMPANLEPCTGYAITARRPAGKAFSIVRMPLTIPSAAWTTAGEQGDVTVEAVTTHKDQVAVTAWAKNDGTTPKYAKGWNFVANPYMSSYEGELSFAPDDPGVDEDEIAYVNIPDVTFQEFEQVAAETAELKPGCGFLIQTEYDGTLTFGTTHRKADAPAYRKETSSTPKQKAYILLSSDDAVDQMGLIIADRYTADYEVNADLEKLLSDGNTLRTYMQYNNLNMAYVAINSTLAQEWIPVSVRIPAAGEYTYSLHRASRVGELEGLYLIDYLTNEVTNLIENDYVFTATAGTITDRFALNAIYGSTETPTAIDVVLGGGDLETDHPVKFIYRNMIYIYYRGVIYDTNGKKVAERRAAL